MLYQSEPLSISLSLNQKYQNNNIINVPLELNLQRHDCSAFSNNDLSTSSVPLGPFTGYALILKGSRFLKPAQQLLEELCDLGGGRRNYYAEKIADLTDTTPKSRRKKRGRRWAELAATSSKSWQPHHKKRATSPSPLEQLNGTLKVKKKNESSMAFPWEKKYNGQSGKNDKVRCQNLQLFLEKSKGGVIYTLNM